MALLIDVAEFEKLVAVAVPNVLIAAKQTRIISASITAYSTAVGPSSLLRKRRSTLPGRLNVCRTNCSVLRIMA
jgi:hypothetical protein